MAANNGDNDDIWRQRFEEVLACLDAAIVGDRPPRYHKLDFPKFDGHGDPLPFLNRCEQFFRGQRTPEDDKVSSPTWSSASPPSNSRRTSTFSRWVAMTWYWALSDSPHWARSFGTSPR